MERPALAATTVAVVVSCGISLPFERLSPTGGQVTHVLLTRAPLYSGPEGPFLARLACVRRAANVRSEPGSNSPEKNPGCPAATRPKPDGSPGITRVRRPRRSGPRRLLTHFERVSDSVFKDRRGHSTAPGIAQSNTTGQPVKDKIAEGEASSPCLPWAGARILARQRGVSSPFSRPPAGGSRVPSTSGRISSSGARPVKAVCDVFRSGRKTFENPGGDAPPQRACRGARSGSAQTASAFDRCSSTSEGTVSPARASSHRAGTA